MENNTEKPKCFVMMPFGEWYDAYFHGLYKPAIEEGGYEAVRADNFYKPGEIMLDIWRAINNAQILVADLTGRNPNVYYELGLAHAIAKPVILITNDVRDIPFDLRALRHIFYDKNDPDWGNKLKKTLTTTLKNSESIRSIPQAFREHVNEMLPMIVSSLEEAIRNTLHGYGNISHLRIFAHSTSTIYTLMSASLRKIKVDKCELILRRFTQEEIEKDGKEPKNIEHNIKCWKALAEKDSDPHSIMDLKIFGIEKELTEYFIIIDDKMLVTGIYFSDPHQPSGINYQNVLCLKSSSGNNNLIKMYTGRFDKMKTKLREYDM